MKAMINSGKIYFFSRPKFSIFLIHWPISGSLNDLKNVLFNFGLENVVETLGDRLHLALHLKFFFRLIFVERLSDFV